MSRYPNPFYNQFAAELNPLLKPPEADIKISPNLIYGAIVSQYIEYKVSIYSKLFCLWFTKSSVSATEMSLELKPQAKNITIRPNFTYDGISPPID
jgi:hypothetical protein